MTDSRESAHSAPSGLQGLGVGALNVGNLLDTVEFVKNAWSAFGVPSSLAPTTDVDELDRRIADLKAVEQWLTVNLNLLRASVQALEIQRATLATLKAYGAMLGAPSGLPGVNAFAQAMAAAASGAMSAATGGAPVSGAASIPATTTPQAAAHVAQTPVAEMAAAAGGEALAPAGDEAPASVDAQAPAPAAPPLPGLDAGAWWELLNHQFNQIAAAALGARSESAAPPDELAAAGGERGGRGGAPVARSRKTPPGPKAKSSAAGGTEPGRRGRRPAR